MRSNFRLQDLCLDMFVCMTCQCLRCRSTTSSALYPLGTLQYTLHSFDVQCYVQLGCTDTVFTCHSVVFVEKCTPLAFI